MYLAAHSKQNQPREKHFWQYQELDMCDVSVVIAYFMSILDYAK